MKQIRGREGVMRNVKRLLHFLTAAVLLISGSWAAAGGGQEEANGGYGPSGKPVELSVSIGFHDRFLADETAREFMSIFPNYTVEIVATPQGPNEVYQSLLTMFAAADDSLDIIGIDPSWLYHMARAGWIVDLSTLFGSGDAADLKDFNKTVFDTHVIDGKPYALPLYTDALMLYYRRDLLGKNGFSPPDTWGELENQARVILNGENDPNLAGYIFQAGKTEGMTCNLVNFLSGVDGEILDSAGNVVLDDTRGRKAVAFMAALVDSGVSPKTVVAHTPNDDRIQFENGQAVFMNNWVFAMNAYQRPESPVFYKAGITRMVGENDLGASCLGVVSIAINDNSRKTADAWEFVKYLTSYDWNKERAMRAGLWSPRESIWDDPDVLKSNPNWSEIKKGASFLVARPTARTQHYLEISDKIQIHLNKALAGQVDAQVALIEAAAAIRHILDQ
jgi:multiple sugar transport system substrate-binding protein